MGDVFLVSGWALSLTARATVVLALALLASRLLRDHSAALRHAVWTLAFAGLLAMPLLQRVVPTLPLPILSAGQVDPAGERLAASPSSGSSGSTANRFAADATRAPAAALDLTAVDVRSTQASHSAVSDPQRTDFAGASEGSGLSSVVLTRVAVVTWALGALLSISALIAGLVRCAMLARRATPAAPPWRALADMLRARLGVRRPVRIACSSRIGSPMTGGSLRPTILLPDNSNDWSAERRRLVLSHELVHVRRYDALRLLLGRVAMALYWFHPLIWVAAREARVAREQACDEAVLRLGNLPSVYAAHLLDIAADLQPIGAPATALPMLGRSDLETRLMAILAVPRPQTARRAATIVAASALTLVATAAATPVAQQAPPTEPVVVAAPAPVLAGSGLEPGSIAPVLAGSGLEPTTIAPALAQGPACWDGSGGNFSGTMTIHDDGVVMASGTLGRGNEQVIQQTIDGLQLCMRAHGDVTFSDDRRTTVRLGDGAWMMLSANGRGTDQSLRIERSPDTTSYEFVVNGSTRAYDDGARAWQSSMLAVLGDYWQISSIRGQVSSLRGQISSIRGKRSSLRGQISSARGKVSSMRGRISSIRGRASSMNGEISSIRGRESSLRGKISSIRGRVSSLSGRISSYNGRISSLNSARNITQNEETRAQLDREIETVRDRIREVEQEIRDYDADARVAEVEAELANYDTAARVAEVEARLAAHDTEAKVAEVERELAAYDVESIVARIEAEIEALDVDGKVREIEARIEALDADRRVAEVTARLDTDLAALRSQLEAVR